MLAPWFCTSSLEICENKCPLFKPLRLWHFGTAAQADRDTDCYWQPRQNLLWLMWPQLAPISSLSSLSKLVWVCDMTEPIPRTQGAT
jgi:hypothetical protein